MLLNLSASQYRKLLREGKIADSRKLTAVSPTPDAGGPTPATSHQPPVTSFLRRCGDLAVAVTGPRDGKLVAPRLAVCAGCEYVTKPAERLWKCTHPRCNCHTSLQEKTHYVRAACPAGKWEK